MSSSIDNIAQSFFMVLIFCGVMSDSYIIFNNFFKNDYVKKKTNYYKKIYKVVVGLTLNNYKNDTDGNIIIDDKDDKDDFSDISDDINFDIDETNLQNKVKKLVEEDVVKEDVVKEDVVKEDVVKEEVVKEEVVKEDVVKEDVVKEDVVKEAVVKEAVVKEDVVKEAVIEETVFEEVLIKKPDKHPVKKSIKHHIEENIMGKKNIKENIIKKNKKKISEN